MMGRAILLAALFVLAPLDARATDLVIWWQGGFNPEEDQAVREIIAAFERRTGDKVEVVIEAYGGDILDRAAAVVDAGHPPDLVHGDIDVSTVDFPRWAYESRLANLADALGPLAAQFDRDALDEATLLDATVGRRGLYALPMGRVTTHVHAWKTLLERAGLTLADIPKAWEPFWSFWCDRVQPAVRKATGRDDIYGVGLPMSVLPAGDTDVDFSEFVAAYGADYVTRDGKLVIDEPQVRAGLVRALSAYTGLYRKGCAPPDAIGWDGFGNNKAFLEQRVVMTLNPSLSIPNALRATRPDDYYRNAVTLGWPSRVDGQPLTVVTQPSEIAVIKAGGHVAAATEFVRFLVADGWLGHWLDFVGDRWLPPLPALLEQPFWLDPGDPHRMASAMQFLTQPRGYDYAVVSGEWRHQRVRAEGVWPKAVHRVVADGLTPERAVDEAVARVHQILGE